LLARERFEKVDRFHPLSVEAAVFSGNQCYVFRPCVISLRRN
jgi:hypothetical protein